MRGARRAAVTAVGAAAVTIVAGRLTDAALADRVQGWRRTNYRGAPVSLGGGAGVAAGVLAGALLAPRRFRSAALVAVGGAAAAGLYDDLVAVRVERSGAKGLRGHLGAMRRGEFTGGMAKTAVIGLAALEAGRRLSSVARPVPIVERAILVAGSANLLNLFDLRPGRAAKIAVTGALLGLSGPAGGLSATGLGAAAADLPADLDERWMLGDLGANTLGALLGVRVATAPAPIRAVAIVLILALTLASERVSFSAVIDSVGGLRRLDELGRGRWGELRW